MDYEITSLYNDRQKRWDVKVSGEIDIFNSDDFKEKMNALITKRPVGLCVDCGELRYIDSTALGVLVSLLKTVREFDCDITLTNVNPNMLRLLKITNLDKSFLKAAE